MPNDNIIKGYKGIMDLDLSLIDSKFHKEAKKRHLAEIKEYKAYQQSLPSRLRYENTTVRALKTLKLDRDTFQAQKTVRKSQKRSKHSDI